MNRFQRVWGWQHVVRRSFDATHPHLSSGVGTIGQKWSQYKGLSPSHLLTYSWSWALLEPPPILQLLKNFPTFYGTRRFITMFTRALHLSLSLDRSIQSIPSHSVSLKSILILFTHLVVVFPVVFFLPAFPPISYMHSSSPPFVLHALLNSSSLTWSF